MACVTIWANSMAVRAGESQPLLLKTSTQAWIRRIAWGEEKEEGEGQAETIVSISTIIMLQTSSLSKLLSLKYQDNHLLCSLTL